MPSRTAAEIWAAVVAWLGLLGACVAFFALASDASRTAILNAAAPALLTLASAATLWLRTRRTEQAVQRTEQLVERRTNGDLTARMEGAVARVVTAKPVEQHAIAHRGEPYQPASAPAAADATTPGDPQEVTGDGPPPSAHP